MKEEKSGSFDKHEGRSMVYLSDPPKCSKKDTHTK